jgi:uncharacterized protein YeaO (DUF488 family)
MRPISDTPVYTSYFSKINKIKEKYNKPFFINIARYISDDIKKHIHRSCIPLIPSKELLMGYKNKEIGEDEYIESYIADNLNDGEPWSIYDLVENPNNYDAIFLLCYEKSDSFCHRHIVSSYLNINYNFNIKEWSENDN